MDERVALVVEDDVLTLEALRMTLIGFGWRGVGAQTLRAARSLVRRFSYAAAIVDVQLPDGCGLEAVRALRSRNNSMRIAVVTGFGGTNVGASATKAGADIALDKPALRADIARFLDNVSQGPLSPDTDNSSSALLRMDDIPTADWVVYKHAQRVLEYHGGNKMRAAKALGRSRNWLKAVLERGAPRR